MHLRTLAAAALAVTFAALGVGLAPHAHAAPVSGQGTWETVLQARDLNGDGVVDAYYDGSRHLSWLADADPIGAQDLQTTRDWVSALNVHGVTGWRLPTLAAAQGGVPQCPDYTYDGSGDCGYNVDPGRSELAHLYQVVLGNLPWYDSSGAERTTAQGLTNTGPFANLAEGDYPTSQTEWLDTVPQPGLYVWLFETTFGYQDRGVAASPSFHAWAVHDGDVGALPVPTTVALLPFGLAVLALSRQRQAPQRPRNAPGRC